MQSMNRENASEAGRRAKGGKISPSIAPSTSSAAHAYASRQDADVATMAAVQQLHPAIHGSHTCRHKLTDSGIRDEGMKQLAPLCLVQRSTASLFPSLACFFSFRIPCSSFMCERLERERQEGKRGKRDQRGAGGVRAQVEQRKSGKRMNRSDGVRGRERKEMSRENQEPIVLNQNDHHDSLMSFADSYAAACDDGKQRQPEHRDHHFPPEACASRQANERGSSS